MYRCCCYYYYHYHYQGRSSSVSSPTQRGRSVTNITVNGSSDTIAGDLILPQENNGYKTHGKKRKLKIYTYTL